MESLYQLLYLCLYLYLGIFTHLVYSILFFYQKRLIFIKTILFFFFIAYLWIRITNTYDIVFNYLYPISYILGFILSENLFKENLKKLNTKYLQFLNSAKWLLFYYLRRIAVPPIYDYIRCRIYTKYYFHKHPWLKPLGIKRLF